MDRSLDTKLIGFIDGTVTAGFLPSSIAVDLREAYGAVRHAPGRQGDGYGLQAPDCPNPTTEVSGCGEPTVDGATCPGKAGCPKGFGFPEARPVPEVHVLHV